MLLWIIAGIEAWGAVLLGRLSRNHRSLTTRVSCPVESAVCRILCAQANDLAVRLFLL